MLIDRILPRQEFFDRERVTRTGFLKREETTTNCGDNFGLAPNNPALRTRRGQVRNRQRTSVGPDHVLGPRTKGLVHVSNSRTRLTKLSPETTRCDLRFT